MSEHRIELVFDDWGTRLNLICPESGCGRVSGCPECGRAINDAEKKPCYDCPPANAGCWLKSWADNVDFAQEGFMRGSVTFSVDAVFDGDQPVVTVCGPQVAPREDVGHDD